MKIKFPLPLLFLFLPFLSVAQKQSPLDIALRYIEQEYAQWGLVEADITDLAVSDQYQTKHNGVTHLYFQQRYRNIPVYNAILGVHIASDGKVVFSTSNFVQELGKKVNATSAGISAQEAVRKAATYLGLRIKKGMEVLDSRGKIEVTLSDAGIARQPIRALLVYQVDAYGNTRLAWDLSLDQLETPDYWSLRIDAENGALLEKANYTLYCNLNDRAGHEYHDRCVSKEEVPESEFRAVKEVLQKEGAKQARETDPLFDGSMYHVFPLPVESPIHGDRKLLTDPSDPEASPFGWHDIDGQPGPEYTITRGNNVHAFLDPTDADTSRMDEPDGGEMLHFDFPYDPKSEPSNYREASVTQLFYMTNMMHDFAYHYGFDEAAGNFQANNYNRGGKGGDAVLANAQDGGAINNANFTAPPEGEAGRVQMYLWTQDRGNLFTITAPAAIAGAYEASNADFGPQVNDIAISGEVVVALDGTGSPTLGCEAIINDEELAENVAMIDRGACFFEEKVRNAEEAGAIAVIICNFEDALVNMGGVADVPDPGIPALMLKSSDCERIRQFIGQEPTVTLQQQTLSGPDTIDGDFDNGVIAHEYAHGISIRLTGGASNGGCLFNDEQMGEGWSDFFTLVTTYQPEFSGEVPRGIGNFVVRSNLTAGGVRQQPYSIDMSINNKVFDDIIGTSPSPHSLGEIWTAMLWDLYWEFIRVYGWDDDLFNGTKGNNMAIQLIIDGMKMQQCQPGFVEARDAIIAADIVNNGGANECLIWEVFSRRGLGWSADQGSSMNRNDGLQAFDVMPECIKELKIAKQVTELINPGDEITVTLTVTNHKESSAGGVIVEDQVPVGAAYIGGSTNGNGIEAPEIDGGMLMFAIGDVAPGEQLTFSYRLSTAPDKASIRQFFDDAENGDDLWSFDALEGFNVWDISEDTSFSGEKSWFVPNTRAENDQVLFPVDPILVSGLQPVLRFYHTYITEPGTDGGLVELSTDGGTSWNVVAREKIFKNSYRGKLDYQTFSIPFLEGFWGDSRSFIDTYIDLSDYIGQEILYRFRFGSVANAEGEEFDAVGWYIDDIEVMDLFNYQAEVCISSEDGDLNCSEAPYRGTIVQTGQLTDINDPVAQELAIRVYPNPAKDWINVGLRTGTPTEVTLSLFSADGRLIRQTPIDLIGAEQIVPISSIGLPPGLYLIRFQTTKNTFVEKVIIN